MTESNQIIDFNDMPDPEPSPAPEVALDSSGRLTEPLPCRSCGYSLQGLEATGSCPECASSIARSIHGDRLQYCDPAWLESIRLGLGLMVIGISLQMVSSMVLPAAVAVATAMGGGGGLMSQGIATLIAATAAMTYVSGAWLATRRDPAEPADQPMTTPRRLARLCITATLFAVPLQTYWTPGNTMPAGGLGATIMGVSSILGLVAIVGWVSLLVYFRRLLLRIPNPRLARHARIVMWGYLSYMSLGLIVGLIAIPFVNAGNVQGSVAVLVGIGLGGCFSGIAMLVFEIWGIVLYILMRTAITQCLAEARAWARTSGVSP